jgi:cytoskeletal protein CcmA (bactofilin family)
MDSNEKQTIIENGTEFDGAMSSTCAITLSGKMKGELSAPALTVTETGAVHGQVMVEQLKSQGEVSGEIDADIVELSGKVNDNTVIRANTLEVKLDQPDGGLRVAFGNCSLRVGEKVANHKQSKSERSAEANKTETKKEPVLAKV